MKICLASHTFLPKIGGAELVIHHLSKALVRIGQDVVVFVPRNKVVRKFITDYQLEFYPLLPKGKKYFEGYIFALYLLLLQKKYKFDLIHIHKAEMGYYVTKLKKLLKIPIIVTSHGRDIQSYPEINYGDRLDPVLNRRIEYTIKKADLLTAISSSTRKHYLDIGVERDKIVDIPNGVDLHRFNSGFQDIRKILKLPGNIKLLLTVGRYHKVKGYEFLIKAMPHVISRYSNIRCLIIGKKLKALKNLIKKSNMGKYFFLIDEQSFNHSDNNQNTELSNIPNDLLLSAYKSCDIYVSSSLIEGFALTLVEAMAAGLPLVATNVPGNEDVIINGKNGFLVPSKDPEALAQKIIELLENENLRTKLGIESRKLATKYDWHIITNQYLKQYKRLVNSLWQRP